MPNATEGAPQNKNQTAVKTKISTGQVTTVVLSAVVIAGLLGFFISFMSYSIMGVSERYQMAVVGSSTAQNFQYHEKNIYFYPASNQTVTNAASGNLVSGWPITINGNLIFGGSAVVTDINNDGSKEVVVKSFTWYDSIPNRIFVFDSKGNPDPNWPYAIKNNTKSFAYSGIGIGDVNNDNLYEISAIDGGGDYREFSLLTPSAKPLSGWPKTIGGGSVYSPTIVDLDNNGYLDVIITRIDQGTVGLSIDAFSNTGVELPGFPYINDQRQFSGVSAGDLNNDSYNELIFTSYNLDKGAWYITVLDHNGQIKPGGHWPVIIPQNYSYAGYRGAPVIADINGDGLLEIIFTVQDTNVSFCAKNLHVLDHNGNELAGFPVNLPAKGITDYNFTNSVAIGDIDKDGKLEIISLMKNSLIDNYHTGVIVLDSNGRIKNGWPLYLDKTWIPQSDAPVIEPVIGDVNNDGFPDIAFCTDYGIVAFSYNAKPISGFPLYLPKGCNNTPTLTDLNGDGNLDIIVASMIDFSLKKTSLYAFNLGVPYKPATIAWPMFQHDFQLSGNYHFKPKGKTIICRSGQTIGDVQGDGLITQEDVDLTFSAYLKSIPLPSDKCCIDTNGDGSITSKDALLISNYLLSDITRDIGLVGQRCK